MFIHIFQVTYFHVYTRIFMLQVNWLHVDMHVIPTHYL